MRVEDMTDEEFEQFILDKIHYFDDERPVVVVPRKKPDSVSLWLDVVNQMKPCKECGIIAGRCLLEACGKECKKEKSDDRRIIQQTD